VSALGDLGRLGLFVEPTATTAGAALTRLLRGGTIKPDQTTIVVLTGTGLKAAERIGDLLGIRPESAG
jgi:threonine synthase